MSPALSDAAVMTTGLLWRSCWQGGLFILAVWLVCRTAPRLPAALRCWLWWLACLKLAAGLCFAVPVRAPLPAESTSMSFLSSPVVAPTADHGSGPAQPDAQSLSSVPVAVSVCWLAGLLVCSVTLLREGLALRTALRSAVSLAGSSVGATARELGVELGLRAPPVVLESASVTAPMVTGLLRPSVALPPGFADSLSPEEVRMALAHELAHVRRRDLWLGLAPILARALFFFFPPAWLACSEWVTAREAACDDEALSATGQAASRYGRLLMKIVAGDSRRAPAPGLGATASYHTLHRRIQALKSDCRPHRTPALLCAVIMVLALPFVLACRLLPPSAGAAGAGPQLGLVNAGFETGSDAPTGWQQGAPIDGVTYLWDRGTAHTGHASLCLIKQANRYFPIAQWFQTVPNSRSSRALKVSAWVKARQAYKAILDVQFTADGTGSTHQWAAYIGARNPGDPPADHDWKLYEGTVNIPAGAKQIVIALQTYGPGTVWFDDVQAAYVD